MKIAASVTAALVALVAATPSARADNVDGYTGRPGEVSPMGLPSRSAIAEPGSLLLLGGGLVALGVLRRRSRRRP